MTFAPHGAKQWKKKEEAAGKISVIRAKINS